MWTRRDFVLLATAAIATFGFTVATFVPRIANAVDETPVTADVKVPTLNLGGASVSAALDPAHARTVLFTVRNTTDDAVTVQFSAQATVYGPTSMLSRVGPVGSQVWSQDLAVDLQPGQTKTLSVELPQAAFSAPDSTPPAQVDRPGTVPGSAYLFLSGKDNPGASRIQALRLWTGTPDVSAPVAKSTS
jgi:hypothetical protein